MPNWCNNTMEISHADKAMIEKAAEAWNAGKFLGTLIPEPDYKVVKVKHTYPTNFITGEPKSEFADPKSAWWDWRIQNWGTKWEIGLDEESDNVAIVENNSFAVAFDSAWSPPLEAYAKLEALGFEINATYYESGCAFIGSYSNGHDECYDTSGTYEDVINKIPEYLDNEYFVSESILQYELDEITSRTNCDKINEHGVIVDDQGNEYRDSNGQIVIVPEYLRDHFEGVIHG